MKKKMKMGQTPKWLAVGVAGLLIVGGIYAISNSSSNLAGNNKQLGAVAASVVSGSRSASTSSVKGVVAVTSYPTFEMRYDKTGGENNLVAKAEYSITAKGGKIYIPTGLRTIFVSNDINPVPNPTKIELIALDPVVAVANCWSGSCYVIPENKTINFRMRQFYNPSVMFAGVYKAKIDFVYFSPGLSSPSILYYNEIPAQTSKLNTITIVGEKSPYLYTTAIEVARGQNFTIKGVRLNGSTPFMEGSDAPGIVSRDDSSVTFNGKLPPPGVYRLYFSHPTYGNSNNAWVTVKTNPTGTSNLTTVANNPATPKSQNHKVSSVDGVQKLTMQAFDVKSTSGPSVITNISVTVNGSSLAALPSTLFLYDGSTLLASVKAPTSLGGKAVFSGLTLNIAQDQVKTLTIKATFPPSVTNGSLAYTSIKAVGDVVYQRPDLTIANGGPISEIFGKDQHFYAAAPQWTLVSASNTVTAGIVGISPSTLTGKITLRVHADGGTIIKPTSDNFSIVFASSTQANPANYNSSNSILAYPTTTVTPTDSSLADGGDYTVEVTGVLSSSNINLGSSQTLFMAIKDIDTSIGGINITNQTWGVSDFFTQSQYLTKGTY